jgi:hypothetical protein
MRAIAGKHSSSGLNGVYWRSAGPREILWAAPPRVGGFWGVGGGSGRRLGAAARGGGSGRRLGGGGSGRQLGAVARGGGSGAAARGGSSGRRLQETVRLATQRGDAGG